MMKKFRLIICLLLPCLFFSQAFAQVKKSRHKKSLLKPVPVVDHTQNIFSVRFPKGKSTTLLTAYMSGLAHPVTFLVPVTHGKILRAEVKEMVEPANIRINQIFLPGGKSDGPFSHKLTYLIKRKGTYKIIVGGNNMQGDDWKGVFTMRVSIQ